MSTAAVTLPRQAGTVRAYASNVALAARSLFAALLAVQFRQSSEAAAPGDAHISLRERAQSV
jgi:hypothetical protein